LSLKENILSATQYLRERCSQRPLVGLVLGTGLGSLAEQISEPQIFAYDTIPHFPKSTVKFHAGRLVCGSLAGKAVMAMQGRFHYYEGYSMQEITLPIRVMHQLGVNTLIVTNAAGGIREHLRAGTFALISDHLNLMGDNPLIGPYDELFGERFPDMSEPYSLPLRNVAKKAAKKSSVELVETVYAAVSGPSYETAAEIRMLRTFGADTVGMSVVPEVLVARQLGIRVLGLSVITDQVLPDDMPAVTHDQVSKVAEQVGPAFRSLVKGIISEME
jgi:purine-nucleoside phosphorylase